MNSAPGQGLLVEVGVDNLICSLPSAAVPVTALQAPISKCRDFIVSSSDAVRLAIHSDSPLTIRIEPASPRDARFRCRRQSREGRKAEVLDSRLVTAGASRRLTKKGTVCEGRQLTFANGSRA